MAIIPDSTRSPRPGHPHWCVPAHCTITPTRATGVHQSGPVSVLTGSVQVTARLGQAVHEWRTEPVSTAVEIRTGDRPAVTITFGAPVQLADTLRLLVAVLGTATDTHPGLTDGLLRDLTGLPGLLDTMVSAPPRCAAAHADDPAPCDGPTAVRVSTGSTSVTGCVRHSAAVLASVPAASVHPLSGHDGAAIKAYRLAQEIRSHHRPGTGGAR